MSAVQGIGMGRVGETSSFVPVSEHGQRRMREDSALPVRPVNSQPAKLLEMSFDQLVEQVEQANRFFLNNHTHLEFSIHKETKAIIVRIINSETQEVIKEIPPEKILDLVAKLWEMAGLLIDERR
ncbi:hypothetical protein JCM14720_10160 [Calditerricola yamamurae]